MTQVWASDLKQSDLVVLLAMADHANDSGGSVHSGHLKLAWKCGVSRRTIERKISRFISEKWITEEAPARQHFCAIYRINIEQLPVKESYQDYKITSLDKSNKTPLNPIKPQTRQIDGPDSDPTNQTIQTRQKPPRPDTVMSASTSLHTSLNIHQCASAQSAKGAFDIFYTLYPKKKDRKRAEQAWKRHKLDSQAGLIIEKLKQQIKKDQSWKAGFAPHPTTYLNGERWNDEIDTQQRGVKKSALDETIEATGEWLERRLAEESAIN